jgi:2-oxoglutarate ferredoxin oxidoreductase subunit delta
MNFEGDMQKKKTRPPQGDTPPENRTDQQPGDSGAVPPPDAPGPEGEEALRYSRKQKSKPLYTVTFFYEWCKSCGICSALCPQKIILQDETGKPYIDDMDNCIGCRFCEAHCPDFAITVKERYPERRRKNDGSK